MQDEARTGWKIGRRQDQCAKPRRGAASGRARGKKTAMNRTWVVSHNKRTTISMRLLLALLLVALTLSPVQADNRFALLIGNSEYTHVDRLANPKNDVALVAQSLTDVGFKVTVLTDIDRRTMDEATKTFANQLDEAGKNAVGVFYYAGHGVSYEGQNWLLPVGARISQAADIEYETLSANKVLKLMEGARNATDILILDACRNNPFPSFSLSGTRSVTVGMARMDAPVGSFIAYSTAPGAVAFDGKGRYSPFAEAFATEIKTPGHSIGDMMIEVRKRVKSATSAMGGAPQTPWDSSSLTGRFAFSPGVGATQPQVPAAVVQTPAPLPARTRVDADTRLWTSIENSTDTAEFALYLKRFPNGQYAELAQIRMKRLQAPAPATALATVQPSGADTPATQPGQTPRPNSQPQDPELAAVQQMCRSFADGDPAAFAECLQEYEDAGDDANDWQDDQSVADGRFSQNGNNNAGGYGQTNATWFDEEGLQWQVILQGDNFVATTNVPGAGAVGLRGQFQGVQMSYSIFDSFGQQIGYGGGTVEDASHMSATSYWSNGIVMGSVRFHVNHAPQ